MAHASPKIPLFPGVQIPGRGTQLHQLNLLICGLDKKKVAQNPLIVLSSQFLSKSSFLSKKVATDINKYLVEKIGLLKLIKNNET
jgi:hypothetical protein